MDSKKLKTEEDDGLTKKIFDNWYIERMCSKEYNTEDNIVYNVIVKSPEGLICIFTFDAEGRCHISMRKDSKHTEFEIKCSKLFSRISHRSGMGFPKHSSTFNITFAELEKLHDDKVLTTRGLKKFYWTRHMNMMGIDTKKEFITQFSY